MNIIRFGVFSAFVGWSATAVQAQSGLYGSPEAIPMNQAGGYVVQTAYQGGAPGPQLAPNTASNVSYGAPQAAPESSSTVAEMLSEPSPCKQGATNEGQSPCAVMPSGGYMCQGANGDEGGCGGNCCQPWYVNMRALYMTRDKPNKVFTSATQAAQVNQGSFTDVPWTWGGEVTIGRRFGCGCDWALEGTYWGLGQGDSDGGPGIPGPYVTPMTFGLTDMLGTTGGAGTGGAQTANQWFDGSPDHHIFRTFEVQNVEANLLRTNICGCECSCASVDFLMGVRWFRFRDTFELEATRAADGSAYAGDEICLHDNITNDLVGFQMGFNANYRFADCWKVFLTPKFGIYNNHMNLDYNLYATSKATGTQYQGSSQTYANPNYPVHTSADGFSFLTQVDLGLDWQITRHISAEAGYRVVAATGIGLSDNQVPYFGNDTQAIGDIDHNGSLVVHGLFTGLSITW